jgi:hypothetical protein
MREPMFRVPMAFLAGLLSLAPAAHGAHRILAADSSKNRIAIVGRDGSIEWEHRIGPLHDLHLLPGGNVLFQRTGPASSRSTRRRTRSSGSTTRPG